MLGPARPSPFQDPLTRLGDGHTSATCAPAYFTATTTGFTSIRAAALVVPSQAALFLPFGALPAPLAFRGDLPLSIKGDLE